MFLPQSAMGLMPQLNAVPMLANMGNQYAGLPATPVAGWMLHFLIGTVLWGLLFAWLAHTLPGASFAVRLTTAVSSCAAMIAAGGRNHLERANAGSFPGTLRRAFKRAVVQPKTM